MSANRYSKHMELNITREQLTLLHGRAAVPLVCKRCGIIFTKPKNHVLSMLKGNTTRTYDYCSLACRCPVRNHLCECCGTQTKNPKFCSKRCAAIVNDKKYPKRKRTRLCRLCGTLILSGYTYCNNCFKTKVLRTSIALNDLRLTDLHSLAKYQRSAYVRLLARKIFKNSGKPKVCQNCGYTKHIEVCHKKAIKQFPDDALVSEINNINNLAALCPNCHWEFDNKCQTDILNKINNCQVTQTNTSLVSHR